MKKYEFETDQKMQPQVSMFHFWVSLLIGVLAFVAAILLPVSGQAQTTISTYCYSATQGFLLERAEVETYKTAPNGKIYTAEYEGRNACNYYPDMEVVCITVDGEIETLPAYATATKDTISARVLCEVKNGNDWISSESVAKFRTVRMERTFEKKHVWEFQTKDGFSGYDIAVEKDIIVATRYLDPVEGCYQLVPLIQTDGQ